MRIPVACNLDDQAAVTQLEEWRALLSGPTVTRQRVSPTELALGLAEGPAQWETVVRLAQREKACCPFFDFTLRIGAEALILTISVPEEAAALLDQFAAPQRELS
ncbi:MAG TPA: hypothetical protein VGY51_10715 [Acidimicrobiales bacterium]|nr:hypothetical protein [Acidimicrobiales bacterium]